MDKEYVKKLTTILNILASIIWIGIYLYFKHDLTTHHPYFDVFIVLLPILSIWIHHYYIIEKIDNSETDAEFLKYLEKEIQAEESFVEILPITIFGTGILLTNYITNLNTVMRDFYLLIVFGLLIPLLIGSLTFTVSNISKKLMNDIGTFASESFAFALFFIIFNKLFTQNYDIYKQYMIVFKDGKKVPNVNLEKYTDEQKKNK